MSIGDTVGKFFGGFWSKLGLYVGYVAIAFAIALGCAAVWFYKQNSVLNTTVGSLKTTVDVNQTTIKALQTVNDHQDKTIDSLKKLRETDSQVVEGLIKDIKSVKTTNIVTKAKLRELEARSEEVKQYLKAPVPAAIRSTSSVRDDAQKAESSSDGHGNED